MKHRDKVRIEFSRQAESFARSPDLRTPEVTDRVADALAGAPVGRVLDLACGPGVLTPTLARIADRVVGVDLTRETLRVARDACDASQLDNVGLLRGLAEAAPFADASFDAAVLRLALHHFEHPDRVLAEVSRLLRGGGRLVVLDLLTTDDAAVAKLHNAIERLRDPSHTNLLTRKTLRAQLTRAGLRVVSEDVWSVTREFTGWAAIIADPVRMASLEEVLRQLARAGVDTGMSLTEEGGELRFRYTWGLYVAEAA